HVVGVADRADGRPALGADAAHFAGRQRDLRPAALAGGQRGAGAGAAAELAAAAGLHLQVVDRHTQRDLPQRHAVADARLDLLAALHHVADAQPLGGQDVGPLAVGVLDQGDPGRPVGVVLDAQDGGGHAVLAALEVDDAVHLLVAAAAEPRGDDALVVAAAGLLLGDQQALLRLLLALQLGEVAHRALAAAGGGRFVVADAHGSSQLSALSSQPEAVGPLSG